VFTFEFIIVFKEGVVVFKLVVELVVVVVVVVGFCVDGSVEDVVLTVFLVVELVVFVCFCVVVRSDDDNASTGKRCKLFKKK
jgi:hypothetical protein